MWVARYVSHTKLGGVIVIYTPMFLNPTRDTFTVVFIVRFRVFIHVKRLLKEWKAVLMFCERPTSRLGQTS